MEATQTPVKQERYWNPISAWLAMNRAEKAMKRTSVWQAWHDSPERKAFVRASWWWIGWVFGLGFLICVGIIAVDAVF